MRVRGTRPREASLRVMEDHAAKIYRLYRLAAHWFKGNKAKTDARSSFRAFQSVRYETGCYTPGLGRWLRSLGVGKSQGRQYQTACAEREDWVRAGVA